MIYVLLAILAAAMIAANILVYRSRHRARHRLRWDDDRMTPTGETFGERESYHKRGELSPGERAMARAIREHLGLDEPE